jgi:hypothetical protein
MNLPFGYSIPLGSVEAGAKNPVVKGRESIHIQRSMHAALVVYGSTKKSKKLALQPPESFLKVVLQVLLEEDTTPPQDVPSSSDNVHNHAQPNIYAQYLHPQVGKLFMHRCRRR